MLPLDMEGIDHQLQYFFTLEDNLTLQLERPSPSPGPLFWNSLSRPRHTSVTAAWKTESTKKTRVHFVYPDLIQRITRNTSNYCFFLLTRHRRERNRATTHFVVRTRLRTRSKRRNENREGCHTGSQAYPRSPTPCLERCANGW